MWTRFKDRQVGEQFREEQTFDTRKQPDEPGYVKWMEFEKISASQCRCTRQVGYGNTRLVGGIFTRSALSQTWDIDKIVGGDAIQRHAAAIARQTDAMPDPMKAVM